MSDDVIQFPKGKDDEGEEFWFHFGAALRIHGDGVPFEEISQRLGVQPTHTHLTGERRGTSTFLDDAWQFKPSIPETEPLERHIDALWEVVRPQVEYLKALKKRYKVDVFCGYRSNCETAGFEISHHCLELFTALEVPFGLSVIV
jgi:hypothetical protein